MTISQEVSHRQIGDSYIHVNVAATLQNNSKVKVELQEGFFLLQQIAPVNDEEIETLYAEVFIDHESEYILWPILEKVPRAWDRGTLIIEPGESHQEICEFIVSDSVKSVLIYSYFFNSYSETPRGWHCTTIHDIS